MSEKDKEDNHSDFLYSLKLELEVIVKKYLCNFYIIVEILKKNK